MLYWEGVSCHLLTWSLTSVHGWPLFIVYSGNHITLSEGCQDTVVYLASNQKLGFSLDLSPTSLWLVADTAFNVSIGRNWEPLVCPCEVISLAVPSDNNMDTTQQPIHGLSSCPFLLGDTNVSYDCDEEIAQGIR